MPHFVVTVTFRIRHEWAQSFLPLMTANAAASLANEPGCLRFDVALSEGGDATEVFLYEVYTSRAAFDVHLASDHFRSFDQAVKTMVVSKSVRTFHLAFGGQA